MNSKNSTKVKIGQLHGLPILKYLVYRGCDSDYKNEHHWERTEYVEGHHVWKCKKCEQCCMTKCKALVNVNG